MVAGDITLPDLGLSKPDLDKLIQEVSIVFHSAATVKFDEPMRFEIKKFPLFFCFKNFPF